MTVSKARVLVAPNAGKSIVERDWLVALGYKITQLIGRGECKVNKQPAKSNKTICETSPEHQQCPEEVQQLEGDFQNLFQKCRAKNYETKKKVKEDAKTTQQNGSRIAIQLQSQKDNRTKKR